MSQVQLFFDAGNVGVALGEYITYIHPATISILVVGLTAMAFSWKARRAPPQATARQ